MPMGFPYLHSMIKNSKRFFWNTYLASKDFAQLPCKLNIKNYRGLAIGVIAFVNSLISSIVQLIFPWELSNLGNALTFFIFGIIALIGFVIFIKILPETKGKSLEELENELLKSS